MQKMLKENYKNVLASFFIIMMLILAAGSDESDFNDESFSGSSSSYGIGEKYRITGENYVGCRSKEIYTKLIDYSIQKDMVAFEKLLYTGFLTGECTPFSLEEEVYVTERSAFSGLVRVRREGEIEEYWTQIEAIKEKKHDNERQVKKNVLESEQHERESDTEENIIADSVETESTDSTEPLKRNLSLQKQIITDPGIKEITPIAMNIETENSEIFHQEYDEFLCNALYQMLQFKAKLDFLNYQLKSDSPYHDWYDGVLQYSEKNNNAIAKDILSIASEYVEHYGQETQMTKDLLPKIKKDIGFTKYLESISATGVKNNNNFVRAKDSDKKTLQNAKKNKNLEEILYDATKKLLQYELNSLLFEENLKIYWGKYAIKKIDKDTYVVLGYLDIPTENLRLKYTNTFSRKNGKFQRIDRQFSDRKDDDPFNLN